MFSRAESAHRCRAFCKLYPQRGGRQQAEDQIQPSRLTTCRVIGWPAVTCTFSRIT